jgi:hypothetical protein
MASAFKVDPVGYFESNWFSYNCAIKLIGAGLATA